MWAALLACAISNWIQEITGIDDGRGRARRTLARIRRELINIPARLGLGVVVGAADGPRTVVCPSLAEQLVDVGLTVASVTAGVDQGEDSLLAARGGGGPAGHDGAFGEQGGPGERRRLRAAAAEVIPAKAASAPRPRLVFLDRYPLSCGWLGRCHSAVMSQRRSPTSIQRRVAT